MWNVLPKLSLFKFLLIAFSALLLAGVLLFIPVEVRGTQAYTWQSYREILEIATPISLLYLACLYLLGKVGWKLFWLIPRLGPLLERWVCPNLNGEWSGKIESNYSDASNNFVSKDVSMTIKADFFGFKITTHSKDNYQNSKVILSSLTRDTHTDTFYISYIFESRVPVPMPTDDRIFEGAAKLEVVFRDDGSLMLDGVYWTNRAWQRNLNTAGRIRLFQHKL